MWATHEGHLEHPMHWISFLNFFFEIKAVFWRPQELDDVQIYCAVLTVAILEVVGNLELSELRRIVVGSQQLQARDRLRILVVVFLEPLTDLAVLPRQLEVVLDQVLHEDARF